MRFHSLATLGTMLTLSTFTTAAMIKAPRASGTETMQLNCTIGMPAMMCNTLWGTDCSSDGAIIQPAPAKLDNGDCSSAHCTCVLAAPVSCVTGKGGASICGFGANQDVTSPGVQTAHVVSSTLAGNSSGSTISAVTSYGSTPSMFPDSHCATVTVIVTHHHHHNHSCSAFTSGGRHNMTATGHHPQNSTLSSGRRHHSMTTTGTQQQEAATSNPTSLTAAGY